MTKIEEARIVFRMGKPKLCTFNWKKLNVFRLAAIAMRLVELDGPPMSMPVVQTLSLGALPS